MIDKIREWVNEPFQPDNKAGVPGSMFLTVSIIWVILVPWSEFAAMRMGDNFGAAYYYRYICLFVNDIVMLGILALTVSLVSPEVDWRTKTGLNPVSWKTLLWVALLAVPVYFLVVFCGEIVQSISRALAHRELPLQKNVVIMLKSSLSKNFFCSLPHTVVFAPVMEEICWRHLVFSFIAARRNATFLYAAIVTSLLFGIAHLNMLQAIPLFVLGMILQFVYLKTRSLFAPVLLHALCNGITVLIVILRSVKGV